MIKIYDGKLTAWLWQEIDAVLDDILPTTDIFIEGVNSYERKKRHPKYLEAREKLIAIARQYSEKEILTPPSISEGNPSDVYHGNY